MYKTRLNSHEFEPIMTLGERGDANDSDLNAVVGVCTHNDCATIGYPGEICHLCIRKGIYSKFVTLQNQSLLNCFIKLYCKGAKERELIPMRRLHGPAPVMQVNQTNENDTASSLQMSDAVVPNEIMSQELLPPQEIVSANQDSDFLTGISCLLYTSPSPRD